MNWILGTAILAVASFGQDFDLPGISAPARHDSSAALVSVEALADVQTVHAGESFMVAVVFDIAEHWHVYWENCGAAGMPTVVELTAPEGWIVGSPRYLRPRAFDEPEGRTYGFETSTVIYVPVTAPRSLTDGAVPLSLDINWLVCRDVCRLGSARIPLTVATSSASYTPARRAPTSVGAAATTMASQRARLPRSLDQVDGATVHFDPETGLLRLSGPAGGATTVDLFPIEMDGVTFAAIEASVENDRYVIRASVEIEPDNAMDAPMAIRGLVALGADPNGTSHRFDLPLDAAGTPQPRGRTRSEQPGRPARADR